MNRRADLHTCSSISYGPTKLVKATTSAGTDLEHDAVRQVGYIRQALSQNKRPTGFFIGAGCPLSIRNPDGSPLIPDVAGLTQSINAEFAKSANQDDWLKLLAAITDDGGNPANIEFVLSYVRQLAIVAGKSTVRDFDRSTLEQLDAKICKVISALVDQSLPDQSSAYHNLAIWVRSIRRATPVHIFTTNYDLLVEQALEESSTPYFDGFVGSRQAFFDLGAVEDETVLPSRWARLWKVHGSLNWRLTSDGRKVVRTDRLDDAQSYLIYPSHLKYDQSRKMPYLAMLDRLKDFLLKPNSTLFISGYSFSDDHINDVLCRSLEANPTGQIFALIYGDLTDEKYRNARECGCQLPNLSILADNRAIIGRIEGPWKSVTEDFPAWISPGSMTKTATDETVFGLGNFAHFGTLIRYLTGETTDDGAE